MWLVISRGCVGHVRGTPTGDPGDLLKYISKPPKVRISFKYITVSQKSRVDFIMQGTSGAVSFMEAEEVPNPCPGSISVETHRINMNHRYVQEKSAEFASVQLHVM